MSKIIRAETFDVVVLGGGNAYRVASKCGEAGMRVALVEKGPLGGTCPHRGCIPSKLYLSYSRIAQLVRDADRFHVDASFHGVNAQRVFGSTHEYVAPTDEKFEQRLPESVTLIRGEGRFVNGRSVRVGDRLLEAESVVLATGSRPRIPEGGMFDNLPYWTSDDVFKLTELPRSITIVGAGLVGCELATFFAEMGVETHLIQRASRVLTGEDSELSRCVHENMEPLIDVRVGSEIVAVEHQDARGFQLRVHGPDGDSRIESQALLLATGRSPNTDSIGVEEAGIEVDSRGHVVVDPMRKTSALGVWAIGDVHGLHPYTHAAAHEAQYLAEGLTGSFGGPVDLDPMPHAVFTHPPLASVGETEDQLLQRGVSFRVAKKDYGDTVAGRAVQDRNGLAKLLISPEGKILGCHLLGSGAPEWIHEVCAVMKWRNHVSSLTRLVHVHPASSEILRDVARSAASMVTAEA